MQALEKRIAALEQAAPPPDGLTIIRRIVWPGHLDAEIDHIGDDGNEWTRQPGETEAAFIDRATCATRPNKCGVKCLIASNTELNHANN